MYSCYHVYSDPPGAHVYAPGGEYLGQTSEGSPVEYMNDSSKKVSVALTLKKRGYAETTHSLYIEHGFTTAGQARANANRLVVVLNTD